MQKITSTCPPTEELELLLENKLSESQQEACTAHMDSCPECQQKIESLATGDSDLSRIVQNLSDVEPLVTSAYWPALRSIGADTPKSGEPAVNTATPAARRIRERVLSFLQPATDAAYLGRLGHFDVMRVLGNGGMGVVLEAFDSKLQRRVAIKVLDSDLAEDEIYRQRFCREARAAASIAHENVVAIYQVERVCEAGLPYFVMQLVAGETLEQRMQRGKLTIKEVIRIAMQAARGLAAAHSKGLIHRDIKPGNILIEEATGVAKLTDFGLARVTEDVKLTRTGFVSGTPLYMAPEQALGEESDPRSDLFSLGAVMYEMCTGFTPFQGSSALSILKQITETKHRPIRELNPQVPEWLGEMIDELLAKDPDDRYQSASDLAEVLEYTWARSTTSSLELPAVCQVEIRRRKTRARLLLVAAAVGMLGVGLTLGILASYWLPGRGAAVVSSGKEEVSSSAEPEAVLTANSGAVWSVAFNPTNDRLAMSVEDGSVRIWSLSTKSVANTLDAHRGVVWRVQYSNDGNALATSGDDGLIKLWHAGKTEPMRVFEHPNAVRGLALSADGQRLFAGDRKGGLRVWSADNDQPLVEAEQPGAIYTVALSPQGDTVATAGSDKTIRLWNAETLTQKLPLTGHAGPVYSLAFNADGTQLAAGGWDKTIRIWDVGSGQLINSWEASGEDVWAIAFSPKGDRLAAAGQDGAVVLWNPDTGERLATYLGHKTAVHAVAFNHDGSLLASGGRDGVARVWKSN
jgi:serine/threonine protein kinase